MAGFMTRLNGHLYEGVYVAGEELTNGVFVELDAEVVKKTAGAKDTVFRVAGKTSLWGLPALDLTVTSVGSDEIYFVENEWDINDSVPYDEKMYVQSANMFVRMHRPTVGEQLVCSVEKDLYDSLEVGMLVTPAANGTIAIKS